MKKTILITGASSGIGKATAKYLSEQGYNLVLVARSKEKMQRLAEQLQADSLVIPFDLQNIQQIEDIFLQCKANDIKLDGLVHSAGMGYDSPVRTIDIEVMEQVTTLNYYSFVELAKYFTRKKYSNNNASIVAISSAASIDYSKGMCVYVSSKAALNASVKVMAKEFSPRLQRVNAILPEFVNTNMAKAAGEHTGNLEGRMNGQTFGIIEPEYIAYLVEFLLSEKSKYITGASIPVSAGRVY